MKSVPEVRNMWAPGCYFLFYKKEEFEAHKGERRAIRLATSSSPDGPWQIFAGPPTAGKSCHHHRRAIGVFRPFGRRLFATL